MSIFSSFTGSKWLLLLLKAPPWPAANWREPEATRIVCPECFRGDRAFITLGLKQSSNTEGATYVNPYTCQRN